MERLQRVVETFKQTHSPGRPQHLGLVGKSGTPPPIVYTKTRSVDISEAAMRDHRILAGFEGGAFVDAYKILRAQVMHRLREKGWNVLGITSPGESEGKTLTAINLAISMAMDTTQTVLLVDADLRRPHVHEMFQLGDCPGLVDFLYDDAPVQDLLIHPGIGRFVIMPGGTPIANSSEALTSPKMVGLVEEFKHRYPARVVLFDLPPLLDTADVLAFSPYTDAILVVVEEGKTRMDELDRALMLLKGNTPVLGTVINKAGKRGLTPKTMNHMLLA